MQHCEIDGTDLSVSRFLFGTASLFNVGGAGDRQRLLEAAVDAGFTHFDTAPYYGFGMAERDLKPMLARHRHVTLTTKVGIYSPGGEERGRAAIWLRKAAGRVLPALSRPTIDWSVARARASLEGSLRRLGRDTIDLFTLHEPDRALLDSAEWRRWLEDERRAGRIARFGIALDETRLPPFLAARDPIADVVQTIDSLERHEADALTAAGRPLQITYGYVSAARKAGSARPVANILRDALRRNAGGAVIVSTGRVDRLAQYRAILAAA